MTNKEKFQKWLMKTDEEGITNADCICMVTFLTVGLSIAFGLIIWVRYCGC